MTTMAATTNDYNIQSSYDSSSITPRSNTAYSRPTAPIRILARRYPLTHGGYKYLEIGINVWLPTPTVEIAVGDNRGNELILDYSAWQFFLQQQHILTSGLTDQTKQPAPLMSPAGERRISLNITRFGNRRMLCIQSPDVRMTMTYPTMRYMFILAPCIARTAESLNNAMNAIERSLRNMRHIAAPNAASAACMIRKSDIFDPASIIDLELLAIIYERNAQNSDM